MPWADGGAPSRGPDCPLVQALNHSPLKFNSFALPRPFCGSNRLICISWGLGASRGHGATGGSGSLRQHGRWGVLRDGLRGFCQFSSAVGDDQPGRAWSLPLPSRRGARARPARGLWSSFKAPVTAFAKPPPATFRPRCRKGDLAFIWRHVANSGYGHRGDDETGHGGFGGCHGRRLCTCEMGRQCGVWSVVEPG